MKGVEFSRDARHAPPPHPYAPPYYHDHNHAKHYHHYDDKRASPHMPSNATAHEPYPHAQQLPPRVSLSNSWSSSEQSSVPRTISLAPRFIALTRVPLANGNRCEETTIDDRNPDGGMRQDRENERSHDEKREPESPSERRLADVSPNMNSSSVPNKDNEGLPVLGPSHHPVPREVLKSGFNNKRAYSDRAHPISAGHGGPRRYYNEPPNNSVAVAEPKRPRLAKTGINHTPGGGNPVGYGLQPGRDKVYYQGVQSRGQSPRFAHLDRSRSNASQPDDHSFYSNEYSYPQYYHPLSRTPTWDREIPSTPAHVSHREFPEGYHSDQRDAIRRAYEQGRRDAASAETHKHHALPPMYHHQPPPYSSWYGRSPKGTSFERHPSDNRESRDRADQRVAPPKRYQGPGLQYPRKESPRIDSREDRDDVEGVPAEVHAVQAASSFTSSMQSSPSWDSTKGVSQGVLASPHLPPLSPGSLVLKRMTTAEYAGKPSSSLLLLAMPEDNISLSETLCTVRENIEVFTATASDVNAPAPGRKRHIVIGQLGLRCIHCRHVKGDRVKRAVCFPSSIKRIYRTVIDMKLDHFKACRFVPEELRSKLNELKANSTRSTGTTMQYFVEAAQKMGMVDCSYGVRLNLSAENRQTMPQSVVASKDMEVKQDGTSSRGATQVNERNVVGRSSSFSVGNNGISSAQSMDASIGNGSHDSLPLKKGQSFEVSMDDIVVDGKPRYRGRCSLALPEDKTALSPLRCFLRENVCAFTATAEDIAVRTPTTFSVVVGQVGIGCIHCISLSAKERSNRAVCFPFSIGRIYQSVADIQRFHLGECKMVPSPIRAKFMSLQGASSKGSKGLATRQYWIKSAKKLGLVDTEKGILFCRDPSLPSAPAVSLDILAQVASKVDTVNKPLVLPEDRPFIAEFLYLVMEQLQPCRFTEADQNKRRMKKVGCIGVECKHCAGKVDGRKFFWSSVNAVESNFVSVHTHMMDCSHITGDLKEKLAELKKLRKEQTAKLKAGSQKAFFARVWARLHSDGSKEAPSPNQGSVQNGQRVVDDSKTKESASIANVRNGIKNLAVVAV